MKSPITSGRIPASPKLSIITPVFNGAKTLEACIQSVLSLHDSSIEHIIIDGSSTDETPQILEHYQDQLGPCLSEPDHGVYDAMNKGVRLATGEWLLFIGADDFVLHPLLETLEHLKDPQHIYYANVFYPNHARIYRGKISTYRFMLDNLSHQCIFYPKPIFERYQYDTRYPIMADYALNIQCYGDKSLQFDYLPYVVAVHSDHEGLSKSAKDEHFIEQKATLVKAHFSSTWYAIYRTHKWIAHRLGLAGIRPDLMNLIGWNK